MAQAVGEIFAEANFKGQKGETSEDWCWHGEKVPEFKWGMEAVLSLDTAHCSNIAKLWIQSKQTEPFFFIGAAIGTQGGHSIPKAERRLHAQVCPNSVQTTPQVYGASLLLAWPNGHMGEEFNPTSKFKF